MSNPNITKPTKITLDDLEACWSRYALNYFCDILNGSSVAEAREDILSLIGSKHDPRENES